MSVNNTPSSSARTHTQVQRGGVKSTQQTRRENRAKRGIAINEPFFFLSRAICRIRSPLVVYLTYASIPSGIDAAVAISNYDTHVTRANANDAEKNPPGVDGATYIVITSIAPFAFLLLCMCTFNAEQKTQFCLEMVMLLYLRIDDA